MFSLEYIKKLQNEATRIAKRTGTLPYIARYDKDPSVTSCQFLGKYIPKGFKKVNLYFVDNSGFGADNEPALSSWAFIQKVKRGFGYAIYETGQFQVYIAEYKRI